MYAEPDIYEQDCCRRSQENERAAVAQKYLPETFQARLRCKEHARGQKSVETFSQLVDEIGIQEKILLASGITKEAVHINTLIHPNTGGKEHDVLISTVDREVYKRLKATNERWGRPEWTPYDYLESIRLFNQIAPHMQIQVLGCALSESNKLTMVTKMPLAEGRHPEPMETHELLIAMGFSSYSLGVSKTLDYRKDDLLILDAHPLNFIIQGKELTPIDIQVMQLH